MTSTRLISDITLGRRHRKDYGDIDALARSIEAIGLLHPVVIHPSGRLVAGERRVRAFKKLGRDKIPVTVVDIEKIVLGEYAENTERKDFTYAEAVAVLREVRPLEEKAARERQRAGLKRGKEAPRSGKLPEREKGEAADKAAKATGKKRRTLEKAEAVVKAAEENPERFGDLAERLETDDVKVDAVHREMKQRQERASYEARADKGARIGDLVAMAEAGQRFSVIYADPPWEFEVYSGKGKQRSAERYYDTESLDAIKAMPIAPLAADNCILFLWGVWPELPGALDVIRAWGFDYKTAGFIWVKKNRNGEGDFTGMGYWTRANSEPCLLATKGSPLRLAQDVMQIIWEPVAGHSAKPEEARRRIERLVAGPYLELFARSPVPGWTVWGNEVEQLPEAAE
jgi:N6-adenosine-specific RNA methylase IME4